jgi:hypothetical protein
MSSTMRRKNALKPFKAKFPQGSYYSLIKIKRNKVI